MTVMKPRASRAAVTDVYNDLRPLIEQIARSFAYKYRRDYDETFADANSHFLEAYHGYDPDQDTTLEQRVQYIVERRLFDSVRVDAERSELLTRVDADVGIMGATHPEPYERRLLTSCLTADARAVVELLLDTPADLLAIMQSDPNPGPASVRRCLRRYLRNTLGWAASKVAEVFDEITEVLS